MDFKNVKNIVIPEGNVEKITWNNIVLWVKKQLQYFSSTLFPFTLAGTIAEDLKQYLLYGNSVQNPKEYDVPHSDLYTGTNIVSVTYPVGDNIHNDYQIYGNSKQGVLPDGYTQLEYIESTGTQYIDTGIKGELESELKFVGQVTQYYAGGNYGHLWGDLSDNTRAITFSTTKSTTTTTTSRFGDTATSITSSPVRMLPLNETVTIIENKEKATSSNGIEIVFNATDDFTTNETLTLFGAMGSLGMTTAKHNFRCFYFSHKKNGVLVQELIPARRNSDNVLGMYDTVNNTFLTNAGDGEFVAGNIAPTPIAPIEIESVGDKSKNLFDIHSNDILWSTNISEDGTVVSSAYNSVSAFIKCKPNTTYSISFTGTGNSVTRYHLYDNQKQWITQIAMDTATVGMTSIVTFTTTSDTNYIRFTFRGVKSQSADLQADTQFEEGSTATSYEPYGYKVPVTVGNKNLFGGNYETLIDTFVDSSGKYQSADTVNTYRYFEVKPNTSYTISAKTPMNGGLRIAQYTDNKTFIIRDAYLPAIGADLNPKITITTINTTKYLVLSLDKGVYDIQLEEGSQATEYVPYSSATTNIYLSEPLRKVDIHADYIDYENQKVVREVKELKFTGYEDWFTSSSSGKHYYSIPKSALGTDLPHGSDDIICSHFDVYPSDISTLPVGKVCVSNNNINFNFDGTNDDIAGFETWLSQNDVKLFYPLTTHVEEQITVPPLDITQDSVVGIGTTISPYKTDITMKYTNEEVIIEPTPEYPLEVESVGDKTVNLLDVSLLEQGGLRDSDGNLASSLTRVRSSYIPVKENTLYTIYASNVNFRNRVHCYNNNQEWIDVISITTGQIASFTTLPNTAYIRLVYQKRNTSEEITPSEIQAGQTFCIEGDVTASAYEPYGYRVPVVVGSQGIIDLGTLNWVKATNPNGIVYYRTREGLPNVFVNYANNKYYLKDYTFERFSYSSANTYNKTISTTSDGITVAIVPDKEYSNTQDFVNFFSGKFLYYQRDIDSEFIAPTTTNIYLNEPLRKIGDYADYIDFEGQKVVRNIRNTILNGSESWTNPNTYQYNVEVQPYKLIQVDDIYCLCDTYLATETKSSNSIWYASVENYNYAMCLHPKGTSMRFKNTDFNSDLNGFKTNLQTNNINIVYPLETPTEEQITLPPIPTVDGDTTIDVTTKVKPSNIEGWYWKK